MYHKYCVPWAFSFLQSERWHIGGKLVQNLRTHHIMFFPIMAYVSTYVTFIAVKPLHYMKYTAKPLLRSLCYLCVVVISIFRTALTIPPNTSQI